MGADEGLARVGGWGVQFVVVRGGGVFITFAPPCLASSRGCTKYEQRRSPAAEQLLSFVRPPMPACLGPDNLGLAGRYGFCCCLCHAIVHVGSVESFHFIDRVFPTVLVD